MGRRSLRASAKLGARPDLRSRSGASARENPVSVDERSLRVGLVFLSAALALAMLLTGCGGSDDRTKVEASLRHYFSTLNPEGSGFPTGAGPPRVKDKGCVTLEPAPLTLAFDKVRVNGHVRLFTPRGRRVSFWHCAVSFGTYRPMRVAVLVDGTEVISAMPDPVGRVHQAPARTYTG